MKYIVFVITIVISSQLHAQANCKGTIRNIYKWDNFETLSIRMDLESGGISNYISLPTNSDESLALMAFASKTQVHIHWSDENVTECVSGWPHNKPLKGYIAIGE